MEKTSDQIISVQRDGRQNSAAHFAKANAITLALAVTCPHTNNTNNKKKFMHNRKINKFKKKKKKKKRKNCISTFHDDSVVVFEKFPGDTVAQGNILGALQANNALSYTQVHVLILSRCKILKVDTFQQSSSMDPYSSGAAPLIVPEPNKSPGCRQSAENVIKLRLQ